MNKLTDFNDMAKLSGLEAVNRAIGVAKPVEQKTDPVGSSPVDLNRCGNAVTPTWPEPQPLTAKIEAEPYPVDALPDTIRAAVEEVGGFVKAPVPLVASSAIAALSLAIQPHYDVERASKLHSPVSTFTLVIAESGERKSTCDGFFTKAIRDYESAQVEAGKPFIKDYNAAIESWEAKRSGIKDKIRQLAKEIKPTAALEADLRDLGYKEPVPPRIPRLIYGDVTPEELAFKLAKFWPSGGVVSAEAGVVFGSHGMGSDSITRNLARLNVLWDGGDLPIDRRTTESFTVRGARLTMGLQVQSATLLSFFEKSGALARGTGFLARFLIAWPESTQGNRPFTEAPEHWPSLAAFNQCITKILNLPVPINENGSLTPQTLTLTPEAKAAWIAYHDAIEGELASGGELFDVRDVASKSADNAARLAALFHVFEGGLGAINADAFERASRIAVWHLNESRRFFGELALPAEMADAARLDRWLIEHCKRERTHCVARRYAQRHGTIRDGARLDEAISELESLDRIQMRKDGKQLSIWLNPALMGIGGEL
jgi:putative DNA primase/helicase